MEWFEKHDRGTVDQIYERTLIRKKYIYEILTRLISEEKIGRTGRQRNTLYYLKVPQVPQVELEWNSRKPITTEDQTMSSTTFRKHPKLDQSDQDCNGLLRPDHVLPDQPEKAKSVELGDKIGSNALTVNDLDVPQTSTNSSKVELNGQKVIKAIGENLITSDQNTHTTNFFDKKRSQESEEAQEKEKESLKGVWHKKEGYMVVIDQRGSKLTVRRSGEQKTQTIYLRGCDSRREYETYCTF